MNALQAFQPRYLKPVDLNASPEGDNRHLVHIERVVTRTDVFDPVAQSLVTRHVLYLLHCPKGLMLNRTQTMQVIEATGQEDTEHWAGHSLIIAPGLSENNYPTITIAAYEGQDPKEAGLHQFAPLPQPVLPTGQQVREARRAAPRNTATTAAASAPTTPVVPAQTNGTARNRRASATQAAA